MLALSVGRGSSFVIARRGIVDAKPLLLQVRPPPAMQLPLALGWKWAQKQSPNLKHFSTQASSSGGGRSESPLINSMNLKIKEQLNAQSVTVTDASGDGRHVSISVVSESFEGKSQVNRQRMVYKVIWEELQTTVHAVDHMSTKTPQEAASSSD